MSILFFATVATAATTATAAPVALFATAALAADNVYERDGVEGGYDPIVGLAELQAEFGPIGTVCEDADVADRAIEMVMDYERKYGVEIDDEVLDAFIEALEDQPNLTFVEYYQG
jgi:hypothetical protein